MAVVFAGGELSALVASDLINVTEVTSATFRDTAFARSSIRVNGNTAYADAFYLSAPTTAWFHTEMYVGSTGSGTPFITFYNNAGTAVFRLASTGSSVAQMQYWNGSTWVSIGSTISFSAGTRLTIDIKIVCGASGSAAIYIAGSLVTSGSASMTSVTDIARARLTCNISFDACNYSQIIAADESTIGWKLATLAPSANGANTAWANDYTAVDEATTVDDADYITSTAAGDVETYAATDAPTGYSLGVKALVVTARAKNAATGPQNLQMAVRSASTNYFSSSVSGLGAGFNGVQAVFATDPATSAAWTLANCNNAEIGVKSIA